MDLIDFRDKTKIDKHYEIQMKCMHIFNDSKKKRSATFYFKLHTHGYVETPSQCHSFSLHYLIFYTLMHINCQAVCSFSFRRPTNSSKPEYNPSTNYPDNKANKHRQAIQPTTLPWHYPATPCGAPVLKYPGAL